MERDDFTEGPSAPWHLLEPPRPFIPDMPDKPAVIAQYRLHETDTGSPEVQIALLTERISHLTEHLRPIRAITTPGAD